METPKIRSTNKHRWKREITGNLWTEGSSRIRKSELGYGHDTRFNYRLSRRLCCFKVEVVFILLFLLSLPSL